LVQFAQRDAHPTTDSGYCAEMAEQGLDAEKLEVLRRWASGLLTDTRQEVAAAGRAVLLLIEEIERLHVLLWDKRLYPDVPIATASGGADNQSDRDQDTPGQPLFQALRDRLRRTRRESLPQPDPSSEEVFNR
jgi:hypothetical protein